MKNNGRKEEESTKKRKNMYEIKLDKIIRVKRRKINPEEKQGRQTRRVKGKRKRREKK